MEVKKMPGIHFVWAYAEGNHRGTARGIGRCRSEHSTLRFLIPECPGGLELPIRSSSP